MSRMPRSDGSKVAASRARLPGSALVAQVRQRLGAARFDRVERAGATHNRGYLRASRLVTVTLRDCHQDVR